MWNWNYTNVNNNFFNKWSPELAYIVGFFLADGSISNYDKCGKYTIRLQCNDKDIIEKMANVCGYKNKIMEIKYKYKNRNNCGYRIAFAGKFIWDFFTKLGFDNNKTHNARVPKQLPNKFINHFIRGVFDGDGSLCIRNRTTKVYPNINIVGTENIIVFISKCFKNYNNFYKCKQSIVWRIDYNGSNARDFLNYMYKDSTIHMDRKYKDYLRVRDWKSSCVRWTKKETSFIRENYTTMYVKDMTKILNRSCSSIVTKAERLGIKRTLPNGKI